MITPSPLRPGDGIAILSPATEIRHEFIDGAISELRRRGYTPIEMPFARGHEKGTYAASDPERLSDLRNAILNPDVKGILCSRGGYGCVHLLSEGLQDLVMNNPKWLIGFSDVSALHALWLKAGVQSIHASMAKQLALFNHQFEKDTLGQGIYGDIPAPADYANLKMCTEVMFYMLEHPEENVEWRLPSQSVGISGEAEGTIIGGNLAVLNGLASTFWDILSPRYAEGKILFLEDVGEKIYQVERMLKRLQLSGTLNAAAAIIFGNFTDYKPDRNFGYMEEMIVSRLKEWGISCPVAINFPIGHTHYNIPIVEGRRVRLETREKSTVLRTIP